LLFQRMPWTGGVGRIVRVNAGLAIAGAVDAEHHASLALQTDRRVDSDPVQPGEEQRVTLETVQRLIRVEEGLLNDVLGVLGIIEKPVHGIVQAILITSNEDTEGGGITF